MNDYSPILQWIEAQHQSMLDQVIAYSNINSYTFNIPGLRSLSQQVEKDLKIFNERVQKVKLPPNKRINMKGELEEIPLAPALVVSKRPLARKQALFVIHLDTVYPPQKSLQEAILIKGKILKGQGVTDAKGGLVVLMKALQAFERTQFAKKIGWHIILNTDEEIGSPGSAALLEKYARRCDVGFAFEPTLPDGHIVGARKGSGNFTVVVRGVSAHAGREFHKGRNAIDAISKIIQKLVALTGSRPELTLNVGVVNGGSALNVVPDLAMVSFNIRIKHLEDQSFIEKKLQRIIKNANKGGFTVELHGGFAAKPKVIDHPTRKLIKAVKDSGRQLGMILETKKSGGVCDGNRMHAVGLPTLDTMGVQGGAIHSPDEYLNIESLRLRTQLMTLTLLKWANGEWEI